MKKIVLLLPVLLALAACSTTDEKPDVLGKVEFLYNKGMDEMEKSDFSDAVHTFEELERQHPYSGWATRAQVMVAYAHFRMGDYDEAVAASERFIRLHPGHESLAYAHYIRALSFYNRISDVKRDQGFTLDALQAFEEIQRRFANTEYAEDAKLKATLCRDHLAGQEMMVGRFYQKQKRFLAAINRYRAVVESYERSSQTPEALYRLTESYLALGISDEAQMAASVLGHNFPASEWYHEAYALLEGKNLRPAGKDKSWLKQLVKGVKGTF